MNKALSILCLALLAACGGEPEGTPSDTGFDVVDYFDGDITGTGVIERGGRVTSRFNMQVQGDVQEDVLRLRETFTFEDQPDYTRTWVLSRTAPGVWTGSAENVIGETSIRVIDGVAHMKYTAEFPNDGDILRLAFDQKLIPLGDRLILNRSRLSKYFIPVGTVTVVFRRED